MTTGIAYLDVEPFPRMKLMKLYYLTMQELKDLPDCYGYKFLCAEMTKYRMKIVDENMSIRAIEDKISCGLIEELIFQAHNEVKLLRIMKGWKPWNYLQTRDFEEKEQMNDFLNITNENPFPSKFERYDNMKHTPAPRRPSASVHPED